MSETEGKKAEISNCWPSRADSEISVVTPGQTTNSLLLVSKHCLEHSNQLRLDYFIIKVATQGFSVFLLSSTTLS